MVVDKIIGASVGVCLSTLFYYGLIARNPYSTELIIGKKGSGKTTLMTKRSQDFIKKGWRVYCTTDIPGTFRINGTDIGVVKFPPNSVILVDEAGLLWNNRQWSKLGMNVVRFMKMCRHERNKLILYTQSNAEIDCAFMRICDRLSLVKNWMNTIGVIRHLKYKQVLIPASDTAEARITDDIVVVPFFLGGITIYWMPKYWKYFDSFDSQIELEEHDFPLIPYPPGIKPAEPKWIRKERKRLKKKERRHSRWVKVRSLLFKITKHRVEA